MGSSIVIERSCSCGQKNHAQCGKHYVIDLADCGFYCGACNGRWWCHASPCNLLGKGTCYNLNFDKYFQGWPSTVCLWTYLLVWVFAVKLAMWWFQWISACKSVLMISIASIVIDFVTFSFSLFFWTFQIQPILKKYDILLVADEVPYLVLIAVLFCSFEPQYW